MSLRGRLTLAGLILAALAGGAPGAPQTRWGGYLESRAYLTLRPDDDPTLGTFARARLQLDARASRAASASVVVEGLRFTGDLAQFRPAGDATGLVGSGIEVLRMDRAHLDVRFDHLDLRVGRQRIFWGAAYVWTTLDVFNRVTPLEPGAEKPGVEAVRATVPLGTLTLLEAVALPESRLEDATGALRLRTHLWGMDMGWNVLHDGRRRENVAGIDLRSEAEIGWWIEASVVDPREGDPFAQGTLGVDETIDVGRGIYLLAEYSYDGSGAGERSDYDPARLLSGRFPAREHAFGMVTYSPHVRWSLQAGVVANLVDGGTILWPAVRYRPMDDVEIILGANVYFVETGDEFRPTWIPASLEPLAGRSQAYSWIRVDF